MRKPLLLLSAAAVLCAAGGWALTAPETADPVLVSRVVSATADPVQGERVFWAAGCASCHAAPEAGDDARPVLSGGQRFASGFGTFVAPNISPHPEQGIGGWSDAEFATALTHGVSPDGRHYYPAFPYTAYARMTPTDIADLKAFMDTLPVSATPNQPHEVGFPFSIRRLIGGWKLLYLDDGWVRPAETDEMQRGRYLVEALGHCGECHTPRGTFGGLDVSRWMAGAPNPVGRGTIPDLTPGGLDWDASEIAYYLETGLTPDYDSAGGHMAEVVRNFARLPAADRAAVAAYVKALPPAE